MMDLRFLQSRTQTVSLATFLFVIVGWLDYLNGMEWQVVPLYLLPVAVAVWGAGRRVGIVYSILAACTWLAAELATAHPYTHQAVPFWNALMLFLVFISVTLILSNLHDLLVTLDRRVVTKTTQLRNEILKRHQAELGQLRSERLAVVGAMAAQMAHEIRNPMGSILLNMDLLSQEIDALQKGRSETPEEATLLLSQMEQEFKRIETVVSDYLGFARLPKIIPQPEKLHAYLDRQLPLVEKELSTARLHLVKEYDPNVESMSLNLDPVQLWQVLLNLIRNAREAMPTGGSLKVSTQKVGDEVQISVSDTGCGITQTDIDKIFTPFFTTKAHGTGLGLAISQQIVSEHGGRLECLSEIGSGTTFVISLPISKNPATPI